MGWEKWIDVHNISDQMKRQASASKAECTPLFLDRDTMSALFNGSSVYTTTTDSCTCVDFSRRKLPCKHMYRLAMELNLLDGDFKSDVKKTKGYIKSVSLPLSEGVAIVEKATEAAQKTLMEFIGYYSNADEQPQILPKTISLQQLLQLNILDKVSECNFDLRLFSRGELYKRLMPYFENGTCKKKKSWKEQVAWIESNAPGIIECIGIPTIELTLNERFRSIRRKIYSYLHRKFTFSNDPFFQDSSTITYSASIPLLGGSPSLNRVPPEDEVTALLLKYNSDPHRK